MLVTRINPFTEKEVSMDLPISESEMLDYENGSLIQNAFKSLDADQREFFISGMLPGDWDELFGEED